MRNKRTWLQAGSSFTTGSIHWLIELNPFGPNPSLVAAWHRNISDASENSALQGDASRAKRLRALTITPLPSHALQPEEIYIRESDFIARFGQTQDDEYGIQINWQLKETEAPWEMMVEVWISIQTQLLDSAPIVELTSQGPSNWSQRLHTELKSDDSGLLLPTRGNPAAWLSMDEDCSLVWLVDPTDQSQIHWLLSDSADLLHGRLFGEFLEKGVIRRARLQLLFSSCKVTFSEIAAQYEKLMASALPLTA